LLNPNPRKTVIIPYVSAYGYTKELALEIEKGIKDSGDIDVRAYDLVESDRQKVLEEIGLKEFISIEELGIYERYPGGITKDTPGSYPMEIHMFLFKVSGRPQLNPVDKNVKETGWFNYEEALERLTHEKDKEFLGGVWKDILG